MERFEAERMWTCEFNEGVAIAKFNRCDICTDQVKKAKALKALGTKVKFILTRVCKDAEIHIIGIHTL